MRIPSTRSVVVCGLFALAVFGQEPANALQQVPGSATTKQQVRIKKLHEAHSAARDARGLVGSRLVSKISRDAQKHADWMATTGQFVHSEMGYWEVIQTGPQTPQKAIKGWLESQAHREILMSGAEIGFGFAESNGVLYWVGLVR